MKTQSSIMFALSMLLIASLACSSFSGGDGDTTEQETSSEQGTSDNNGDSSEPQYEPGYEPGWRIFSNANFVNGIDIYDGTLWAATEGGVVAWDVESGQFTKYTPLDGVGYLSTYDVVICPMPDPTVVVATERGLSLYNLSKKTWDTTPITPEDSHVAANKIDKLFCDEQNGRLLISYSGIGILDIASGAWQHYLDDDGLAWNGVDDMTVVGTNVWAAGYKGISVISDQGIQIYNEESGMPEESSDSVGSTPDGAVWVATSKGLIRFMGGSMSIFNNETSEGLTGSVDALTVAPDGTVWTALAAYGGARLCQFDPAQEACLYTYEGDDDRLLSDIVAGNAGDVYYATYGDGIRAYDGSDWRNFSIKEDQLASNFVYDIFEDPNGMLWVGTDNGVQTFDPGDIYSAWTTYEAEDGKMPSNKVKSIQVSPSGDMWFTHESYVSSFNGSSWTQYGDEEGVTGSVFALAFGKDGVPYVGMDEGLVILGDGSFTLLTDADGLPNVRILSLLYDGEFMWIGTSDGLARYDGVTVEVVLDESWEGLPNDAILSIIRDQDGRLLLGTTEGLARYDSQKVTTLLEPQAVSGGIFGSQSQSISGIALDLDGSLWVSTYGGLYHGDGQNWEHFSTADGLPANNLNTVFVNSTGVVWVGGGYSRSGGGIARYIPGEADKKAPATDETNDNETGSSPAESGGENPGGAVKYDENTSLPLYPDAEQVYSTDSVLNYWSASGRSSLREFYLTEMPNIGWLLDVDENGNCRDDERCMGWSRDYNDPETQTYNFLKGDKGYVTLNLIPEDGKVNIIFMINEPDQ